MDIISGQPGTYHINLQARILPGGPICGSACPGKPWDESGSGTRARHRTEFRRPPGDGARVPPPSPPPLERTAQVFSGGARVAPPARGQGGVLAEILQPPTPPWCRAQVPQPHFPPRERSWQVTAGIGQCGTSDQPSLAPGWKILETPGCGAQVLRPPPRDRKGPATPGVGVGGARAAPAPRPARDWKRGKGSAGVRGTRKAAAGWRPNGGVSAAQEPQQ